MPRSRDLAIFVLTDRRTELPLDAQGVKQSVCMSVNVVVVVGTKITGSCILGICACCKHNQSLDIGEKLVCRRFELVKKA